ncbi:MAG TPA: hypothetical protein VN733_04070 [Solirubrobacterales bacterium]|nr:hypothetical protein [Solirubrobacterales bacterium]
MLDPASGLTIAKAVLPLVSFLGRPLAGDEKTMVERSFKSAIKAERRRRQLASRNGWLGQTLQRAWNGAKEQTIERSDLRDEKDLAKFLAETWASASVERALRQNSDAEGSAEGDTSTALPKTWPAALVYFLQNAALEGTAEPAGGMGDKQAEARRSAWRRVMVTSEAVDEEEAKKWATRVAHRVRAYWREKPALHPLIAQLEFDSRQGLVEVIALSSRDVARSLQLLVVLTLPAILLGGGGMTLLVLYIDKG